MGHYIRLLFMLGTDAGTTGTADTDDDADTVSIAPVYPIACCTLYVKTVTLVLAVMTPCCHFYTPSLVSRINTNAYVSS
jgi:hypothetical protein